jgi:cold-inducible RNA-binding protein
MGKRLYVGNLSYNTSDAELRSEFSKCGAVTDVKIIIDRETGRSRGFGFVEFATEGEANTALQALNGSMFGGRSLVVKIAEERARGGGNRFSGGGPKNYGSPPPQDYGDSGGGGGGRKKSRRRGNDSDWG